MFVTELHESCCTLYTAPPLISHHSTTPAITPRFVVAAAISVLMNNFINTTLNRLYFCCLMSPKVVMKNNRVHLCS